MPELPQRKVGIVACSGEDLPEGTITRLAALHVLEQLRPSDTVTICLPLFLAGGEGDRAFARFYPTIAIDGCDRRCAARGTEMYSGKPVASVVVTELVAEKNLGQPEGLRLLNEAGQQAVAATAERVAALVDDLLGKKWDRRSGGFVERASRDKPQEPVQATCSCGSGIPIHNIEIAGQSVVLVAVPLIFKQFRDDGRAADENVARELFEAIRIYNPIPDGADASYIEALLREYTAYLGQQEAVK